MRGPLVAVEPAKNAVTVVVPTGREDIRRMRIREFGLLLDVVHVCLRELFALVVAYSGILGGGNTGGITRLPGVPRDALFIRAIVNQAYRADTHGLAE